MNITRIKQYSFSQLLIITFYKFGYKTLLFFEYLRIKIRKPIFLDYKGCCHNKNISSFSVFFDKCNKTNSSIIINEADEILRGVITVFITKVKFNPEKDWLKDPIGENYWDGKVFFAKAKTVEKGLSDVKYVLEINKFNHLVRIALAYYHTKEKKYLEYLNKSIKGFIRCVPYERSVVNKIIMDQGFRTINLIQISLLCWGDPYFQKFVYPNIHSLLLGYERQMRIFNTPRWFKTGNGVNHNVGEMIGLIITQLWLSQLTNITYKKNITKEYEYLFDVLDRTIAPSGAYLEQSANYARVVLEFLIIFEVFILEYYPENDLTKKYLSKRYKERLGIYMSDLFINGELPNFGDNDDARVLWAYITDKNDFSYLDLDVFIDYKNKNRTPNIITKYLDGSQWIFKSNDYNQVMIFTRVGKLNYSREAASSHSHNDLLSILLSIKGQEIFIDRGTSFYNSGKCIRYKDLQTSSHNTINIDNVEMSDILNEGFKDYPKSGICNTKEYLFSGYVKYKNLKHIRSIDYYENEIIITDDIKITKGINSLANRTGNINYLLAEDLLINTISKRSVILNKINNKFHLIVEFEGIRNINIKEIEYYPHYANERKTKMLNCQFDITSNQQIRTFVKFVNL